MHIFRTLLFGLLTLLTVVPAGAAEKRLTVVELFTSEGCSSCPPADEFLGDLARRDDILALSLHVDYWDYIGWKDPFGDARFTRRQRDYGDRLRLRYVYTPQVVVDGAYETVGSDRAQVLAAISRAQALPRVAVRLTGTASSGMAVELPAADVGPVNVYAVFYARHRDSNVRRGENSGRKLSHANVVLDMNRIAEWNGSATSIPVAASPRGGDVCAVILQSASSGHIIGAARLALDGKS